ncbi:uncharacterized protein LOC117101517 [Anneissia japonica]|uniref:uncharacterized protein LOC117101517 n=1 Tax=Anneissia japonica TaxID=1529436 RepID=UPI0014259BB4|nr:uncharacterized protein LOC117101517 [Anneissia japonica]
MHIVLYAIKYCISQVQVSEKTENSGSVQGRIQDLREVSHSWKETIEHLEQYYQLWRHLCLRDIHRASLIDIIGFNPLSDDYQQKDSVDGDAEFEDLWKNVYRTWRTSQVLSPYKRISYQLTDVNIHNPGLDPSSDLVQIGTYVYILKHICGRGAKLFVWNIDTGHRVVHSQTLKGILFPNRSTSIVPYLQNPLCKFSKHQNLTQHSLIISRTDNSLEWWVFSDGEFRLVKTLYVRYKHVLRIWHNKLVIASEDCIKVYNLEIKENEYNFHLCKMSEELQKRLLLTSINVWDNKCLFRQLTYRYVGRLSIVIYDLDDLQPQVFQVSYAPRSYPGTNRFMNGDMLDLRIFGDCVVFTVCKELYVFNTKTGEQVMLEIDGAQVERNFS